MLAKGGAARQSKMAYAEDTHADMCVVWVSVACAFRRNTENPRNVKHFNLKKTLSPYFSLTYSECSGVTGSQQIMLCSGCVVGARCVFCRRIFARSSQSTRSTTENSLNNFVNNFAFISITILCISNTCRTNFHKIIEMINKTVHLLPNLSPDRTSKKMFAQLQRKWMALSLRNCSSTLWLNGYEQMREICLWSLICT